MTLRTLAEAVEALARLTNYERTRADGPRDFDLSRPRALLENLGSPHLRLGNPVLQVAGTKGKGSVARFLESILRATGRRTGLFTSPHLESVLERIAVDGRPIGEADFAARVDETLRGVRGETTFFECTMAAACLQFARCAVDATVLEVGLGGRLDATTCAPSTHTLITTIGLEHTEILGPTLERVAAEKAGTIRPGTPVWCGEDPDGPAGRTIARISEERGAPLFWVPPPGDGEVRADAGGLAWRGVRLRALGRHQAHNAALAAAALAGTDGIDAEAIARGLAQATQPGCCERRDGAPVVVLDGAHTAHSIRATLRAVADHFPGAVPALVFALAQDKDLDAIAGELAPRVGPVFCVQVDDKRGRAAAPLAAHPAWGGRARACRDVDEALDRARNAAGADGLVLATGSLYLAGALRGKTRP